MSKPFELNCKRLFLTYSNVEETDIPDNISRDRILDRAKEHGPKLVKWVVAQERHEDGRPHFHALFEYARPYHLRDCRAFDILGYHPKIEPCRSFKDSIEYLRKSDEVPLLNWPDLDQTWRDILGAPSADCAKSILVREKPRDAALYGERILNNWKVLNGQRSTYRTQLEELGNWDLPEAMRQWANEYIHVPTFNVRTDRLKPLILIGETRLGKSRWARCLGEHSLFTEEWKIENWNPEARYAVWDDVAWASIPSKKSLLCNVGYGQSTFTDKYAKKTNVVPVPTIICTNDDEQAFCDDYWKRNAVIIRLYKRLY